MSGPIARIRTSHVAPINVMVRPAANNKSESKEERSMFAALKMFMRFSQILGILPQEKVNASIKDIHFKWLSWKILYTLIIMISFSLAVTCCFVHWVMHGSSINGIATAVFYGGSLVTMILHLQLARSWSKLMRSWYAIDIVMNASYGYPETLDTKIRTFSIIFLALGVADFLLSVANRIEYLSSIHANNLSIVLYYNDTFPQLFAYIPLSAGSVIFCTTITIHSNLTWALNDVFIILTSTALAMRFQQISQALAKECEGNKNSSLSFWKTIREDYDRLANFCKELDSYISPIVLLSYFLNVFFLLIQLYYSIGPLSLFLQKVYFLFSFVYLIYKITTVSLYAAWINDESKSPTYILNSVDSSIYNMEIRRFLTQISFDKTALTGCKMFSVKRGIILSVASAIVTYELVLIQFSRANFYGT